MKERQSVTATLLETRELYEEHIGPMSGTMPYIDGLKELVKVLGAGTVIEMIKKRRVAR